jgi:hypothetical protein
LVIGNSAICNSVIGNSVIGNSVIGNSVIGNWPEAILSPPTIAEALRRPLLRVGVQAQIA